MFRVINICEIICSTSPPGGNQVDGLPPASSSEYASLVDEPHRVVTETETHFWKNAKTN